jgi:hypothetical protein
MPSSSASLMRMSSIGQIISNLEIELQQLLVPYKEKIEKLELENQKLISEIKFLNEEKGVLLEELNVLRKKEMEASASLNVAEPKDVSLLGTLEEEYSLLLLSQFNDSIEDDDMEKVHHILELFCQKPRLLSEANHGINGLVAEKMGLNISKNVIGKFIPVIGAVFGGAFSLTIID